MILGFLFNVNKIVNSHGKTCLLRNQASIGYNRKFKLSPRPITSNERKKDNHACPHALCKLMF